MSIRAMSLFTARDHFLKAYQSAHFSNETVKDAFKDLPNTNLRGHQRLIAESPERQQALRDKNAAKRREREEKQEQKKRERQEELAQKRKRKQDELNLLKEKEEQECRRLGAVLKVEDSFRFINGFYELTSNKSCQEYVKMRPSGGHDNVFIRFRESDDWEPRWVISKYDVWWLYENFNLSFMPPAGKRKGWRLPKRFPSLSAGKNPTITHLLPEEYVLDLKSRR